MQSHKKGKNMVAWYFDLLHIKAYDNCENGEGKEKEKKKVNQIFTTFDEVARRKKVSVASLHSLSRFLSCGESVLIVFFHEIRREIFTFFLSFFLFLSFSFSFSFFLSPSFFLLSFFPCPPRK